MAFRPRQQSSGDFKPVDAGAHIGVCSSVVDVGLQGGGQYDPAYKVVIGWSLPTALTDAGKPMTISQTYTNSMNKKANLRKAVEAWFGKAFPSEEAANEFDLSVLLGRSCMVNVVHKQGTNDKTYANVNGLMPLPAGVPKPAAPEATLYYAPTDDTQTADQISGAYAALPEWLRKKVDAQLAPEGDESELGEESAAPTSDDDIPF